MSLLQVSLLGYLPRPSPSQVGGFGATDFVSRQLGGFSVATGAVANPRETLLPMYAVGFWCTHTGDLGGKVAGDWGLALCLQVQRGTGKTIAAEVLARELRLDLYRIDLSAVISKYIGETEKNLRRVFDAASLGGVILLFDEADALSGKCTSLKDSHDRHANGSVSYLLQRMEAYRGLSVLTTNLKSSLDQAFLRRIRFIVQFPFPDATMRALIWHRVFPKATPTLGLDPQKLAHLNVAGGNIRNIALNAAFLAANAGEVVMMKHVLQATKSEYMKLERPRSGCGDPRLGLIDTRHIKSARCGILVIKGG